VKFLCLADEDTVRGFRLAGVQGEAVESAPQAAAALERAAGTPDCGIIILTENIAAGIRAQVDRMRLERELPLIVEIPGPMKSQVRHGSLRELVQQAVGISMSTEGSA
jgi:V/A-type H+/Na+-transporting ATPase subunit F